MLIYHSSINAQMYKTWLFNNKKKKKRKDMIRYERKWMPRMVIYQQNWEEVLKRIEDESGEKPGAPEMFKHYQAAVKRVMAELDEDELEKAKETAEEWSTTFHLLRYKHKLLRRRAQHIWSTSQKRCGGEVLFGMHDDNEALGDGDSFMKTKDWEAIGTIW
ncbi:hypothetical protein BDR04DRAFT_1159035 [Suillus decipiens]|nr:hypothetical protein BDR04DRAFT_1159035 [Suillus decipiens]